MNIPKNYFHDRLVLLILSINTFLAVATSAWILLRLSANHGNGYIVQYRSDLGINPFKVGSLTDLLSFIGFALLVWAFHTFLSMRVYHINRQLSVVVLALAVVLLVLAIIVSNALLVLR